MMTHGAAARGFRGELVKWDPGMKEYLFVANYSNGP